MMRLKILLLLLLAVAGLVLFSEHALAAYDPLSEVCKNSPTSPACQPPADPAENPVLHVINVAIGIMAFVGGVGAIIMIMLGAFFYATSSGNAENAAKARARITSGLIGLVVIAFAYTIIRFVTHILS